MKHPGHWDDLQSSIPDTIAHTVSLCKVFRSTYPESITSIQFSSEHHWSHWLSATNHFLPRKGEPSPRLREQSSPSQHSEEKKNRIE
jgi:hypothetical protein